MLLETMNLNKKQEKQNRQNQMKQKETNQTKKKRKIYAEKLQEKHEA